MAVLLLLFCLLVTVLCVGSASGAGTGKKEVLLRSAIAFSLAVAAITEILSACKAISFTNLCITWGIYFIFFLVFLLRNQAALGKYITTCNEHRKAFWASLDTFGKTLAIAIIFVLVLIFVQGIVYPPNNWDSMAYHMARIPSWISHHSVAPYPTHITRQIYQPPFAEYFILNADVLNRADYFSAAIQFIYLLACLVVVAALAETLGLNRRFQLMAMLLTATLPEAALQASSTQNDIVVSFFILSAAYFAVKAIKQPVFDNYIFLGISCGLAMLTKGTAYVFLAPILLVFGIALIITVIKNKRFVWLGYGIVALAITIAINVPEYCRNYQVTQTLLGTDAKDMHTYSNEQMSPAIFVSAVVKNAGLHMGILGTNRLANVTDKAVLKFHELAHVDENNPLNNFGKTKYSSPKIDAVIHEDSAPNFLQLVLIVVATVLLIIAIIKRKIPALTWLLLAVIVLQISIFCAYLKWQPWNTRLHTPVFMLSVLIVAYAASVFKWFNKAVNWLLPLIIIYALAIVVHNSTRPYIALKMTLFEPRYQKYFANLPDYYYEYEAVEKVMHKFRNKNIGLITAANDYEYPLFTDCYSTELNPVSIDVDNVTKNIQPVNTNVDCIVSTTINHLFIEYKGKRYFNQNTGNKHIYLYE